MKHSRWVGALLWSLTGLLLLGIFGPGGSVSAQFAPNAVELRVPTTPLTGVPDASYNWAGYVAEGGSYSAVSGTWRVPSVTPSGDALRANATWVGVGGVGEEDLIQAGTQALDINGQVQYQAWYELLPGNPSVPMPLKVSPGDMVTFEVKEVGESVWEVRAQNHTTNRSFATTLTHYSTHKSAEWIEEMPSLARAGNFISLAYFDRSVFTAGSVVVDDKELPLFLSGAQPVRMVDELGQTLAEPSELSEQGFTVLPQIAAPASLLVERRPSYVWLFFSN